MAAQQRVVGSQAQGNDERWQEFLEECNSFHSMMRVVARIDTKYAKVSLFSHFLDVPLLGDGRERNVAATAPTDYFEAGAPRSPCGLFGVTNPNTPRAGRGQTSLRKSRQELPEASDNASLRYCTKALGSFEASFSSLLSTWHHQKLSGHIVL